MDPSRRRAISTWPAQDTQPLYYSLLNYPKNHVYRLHAFRLRKVYRRAPHEKCKIRTSRFFQASRSPSGIAGDFRLSILQNRGVDKAAVQGGDGGPRIGHTIANSTPHSIHEGHQLPNRQALHRA
ncbi:Uncharacterized protein FKW44_003214 [Caligus rogercresseyi]|uniref:Uncharacterized protein n=1 Tax=Caligus rogercresseyi TaxID=217165 RepID=A0A7T8QWW0_CALRO|nr:Uncharacterized protein FKW44_003214 [Caligus rogercresseyi]